MKTSQPKSAAKLPQALKKRRGELGLSQEALAESAGLSRGLVARLERSPANPLLSTLDKLARALNTDVQDLLRADAAFGEPRRQLALLRVGGNIAKLRNAPTAERKKKLSQEVLSKLSGHFRTYVTELEMARNSPTLNDLDSVASGLSVDAIVLFDAIDDSEYKRRLKRFESDRSDSGPVPPQRVSEDR
jgi:transcriptional regulator with XRE-family HTH domain